MDAPRRWKASSTARPATPVAKPVVRARRPVTTSYHLPIRPPAPEILARLGTDAAFQVVTEDGRHWIDPYTGEAVAVATPGIWQETARRHLITTGSWRSGQVQQLAQLLIERWRLDLTRLMPLESRLRIFVRENGAWINPWTGESVLGIERPEGKITPRTVWQLAQRLSTCPQAQGPMLSLAELQARFAAARATSTEPPSGTRPALSEDLTKAQAVQRHMLADMPKLPGYELAVHLSAHAGVGGDFYEVCLLKDGRLFFALGDVSGHGVQAALVVATALKSLRYVARDTSDLTELISRFNDEIKPDLVPGQFITLFAAVLDPGSRNFICVRAGHQPALLVNLAREDVLRRIGRSGMAVGITAGPVFAATLRPCSFLLEPGDILVQCTDGALEAMDGGGVEFGEARYLGSILRHYQKPVQALVDGISAEVHEFAKGTVGDDLTLLALAVAPEPETASAANDETVETI